MNETQATILQMLTFLIPTIGLVLPGILKQNTLPPWANGLIALSVVLIVSGLQAWAAGKLGVDPYLDFPIVVAGMSALLAGPFHAVDLFLQNNVGLGAHTSLPTTPTAPGVHSFTSAPVTPQEIPSQQATK